MLLRPAYLSRKLDRPSPTKDGGTLHTIGEAVAYMTGSRDPSPLAQICARVDYVDGLQETLKDPASEEVRTEIKTLVEQCRTALRDRTEEND
jgi:hypothetical protein